MSQRPCRRVGDGVLPLVVVIALLGCTGETTTTLVTTPSTTTVSIVAPTTTEGAAIDAPTTAVSTTSIPTFEAAPATTVSAFDVPPVVDWVTVVDALGPLPSPSDCPLPLGEPGLLPNADRSYRGGVHQGIDFVCLESGHIATAPLPGHVVLALHGYQEPTLEQRDALLEEAKALGYTPATTLQFLFGRFVVIDHGVIPEVGHVISVYAHLDSIDPSIQPGALVGVGDTVGMIGNSGTETAVANRTRPQSIHLHWELHINGVPLTAGLGFDDTNAIVARLFGSASA